MARDVNVRSATPDELSDVLGVLDAGALETDAHDVRAAIDRDDALVAVSSASGPPSDGPTVIGALVLDGREITAVAVRRRRRAQGIGSALVEAAADRVCADGDRDPVLVAEFDGDVRPFYEALGFDIDAIDAGRFRGRVNAARF